MNKKYFKIGTLAILLVFSIMIFTACGEKDKNADGSPSNDSQDDSSNEYTGKEADMTELKAAMLEKDSALPEMSVVYGSDENAANLFSYLAEYDYDNVADYFFSYAATGTAEEIAVIRLKDKDNASECLEAVKKHVEGRIIQFQTYDPSQVKRCEKALVFSNENYVVLIIADAQADIKAAFYDYFSE